MQLTLTCGSLSFIFLPIPATVPPVPADTITISRSPRERRVGGKERGRERGERGREGGRGGGSDNATAVPCG